jgi:hypothetical protein
MPTLAKVETAALAAFRKAGTTPAAAEVRAAPAARDLQPPARAARPRNCSAELNSSFAVLLQHLERKAPTAFQLFEN